MSNKEYNPGKIKPLVQIIARLVQVDPTLADDMPKLLSRLGASIPSLKNKKKCANCGANMVENIYFFDIIDAILLLEMAKMVRYKVNKKGMDFTVANKIHVPTLATSDAVRHRTTKAAKLGLVAKYITEKGTHQKGMWVITRRGWAAMRGDMVPKSVKVWRNKITNHIDGECNLYEIIHGHHDKIEAAIAKNKDIDPDKDYRVITHDYDADEWVHWGETQQGYLI